MKIDELIKLNKSEINLIDVVNTKKNKKKEITY
jgi:hypothetical protein